MKKKLAQQIKFYTKRLATMKENRAKHMDSLSQEGNDSFDELIRNTAEFVRVLKDIAE
jgi:DNA mismatch repair ATPase MutS